MKNECWKGKWCNVTNTAVPPRFSLPASGKHVNNTLVTVWSVENKYPPEQHLQASKLLRITSNKSNSCYINDNGIRLQSLAIRIDTMTSCTKELVRMPMCTAHPWGHDLSLVNRLGVPWVPQAVCRFVPSHPGEDGSEGTCHPMRRRRPAF